MSIILLIFYLCRCCRGSWCAKWLFPRTDCRRRGSNYQFGARNEAFYARTIRRDADGACFAPFCAQSCSELTVRARFGPFYAPTRLDSTIGARNGCFYARISDDRAPTINMVRETRLFTHERIAATQLVRVSAVFTHEQE